MEEKELKAWMQQVGEHLKAIEDKLSKTATSVSSQSVSPEKQEATHEHKQLGSRDWFDEYFNRHLPDCPECQKLVVEVGKKYGEKTGISTPDRTQDDDDIRNRLYG